MYAYSSRSPRINSRSRTLLRFRTGPRRITITKKSCTRLALVHWFTNVPLDEPIQICLDKLYALPDPPTLPRSVLKVLLEFATKKSHFIFNGQYYDQIDGVAMGSPLGPVLANIFMCHFEEKWVLNNNARPSVWLIRVYVDDVWIVTLFGYSHQTTQSHFFDIYLPNEDLYRPLHKKWDSSTPRKYTKLTSSAHSIFVVFASVRHFLFCDLVWMNCILRKPRGY